MQPHSPTKHRLSHRHHYLHNRPLHLSKCDFQLRGLRKAY